MLDLEWFSEQRVTPEIKHSKDKITTSPPIPVQVVEFF
jgi:hypothetical protein